MIRTSLTVLAATLVLAACGEPATPAKVTPTVEISGLYITDPSGNRDVASGGMTLIATGGDYTLTDVTTDAADRVEMHDMAMNDGVMQMRQKQSFTVKDGEPLSFEPGGAHLMLFGWDEALDAGDTAELLFTFTGPDGADVTLNYEAAVKNIGDDHSDH